MHTRPYNPDGVQGYLITIRCYGTWFHGDERHSMRRDGSNVYGSPPLAPNPGLAKAEHDRLRYPPCVFSSAARNVVELASREVCRTKGWALHVVNAQRDHVHMVITGNGNPEKMMGAIKSIASRRLREAGLHAHGRPVWSRHGSTKYLWNPEEVERACDYVLNGQKEPPQSLQSED